MVTEAGAGQVDDGVVALQGGGVDGVLDRVPCRLAGLRQAANEAGDVVAVRLQGGGERAADKAVGPGDDDSQAAATCRERSITWSMMP